MITLLLSEAQRSSMIKLACQLVCEYQGSISVEDVDKVCDMPNHKLFVFIRYAQMALKIKQACEA